MKRLYSFLSFILLSLVGITQAVAQEYEQGNLLTDMADIVGKDVLLYSPGTTNGKAHYMCGVKNMSENIGAENFYQFEVVDGELADGEYTVYRLKQKSTGLYYKAPELDADGEGGVEMTANPDEAFKFTALPFEEVEADADITNVRTQVTSKNQNLDQPGFVFAASVMTDGATYLNGYTGGLHFFPYNDTNVWLVYEANTITGEAKLMGYQNYYGQPEELPHGADPGSFDQSKWQAYNDAFYAANDLLSKGNLTDEEVDAACAKMKETYEAMAAARNKIVDGYYYIHDTRGNNNYLYSLSQNGKEYLGSGTYQQSEELGVDDAKYIWHIVPAEEEDQFYLENYFTKSYVTNEQSGGYFLLGNKMPINVPMEGQAAVPSFLIWANDAAGSKMMYNTSGGKVLKWNDAADNGNCFKIVAVDQSVISKLEETVKQIALNTRLQNLYTTASNTKAVNDGTLGVVTSDAQLSSNAAETTEGSLAALLDNDYSTYFHTAWSATPTQDYHYLQADLGQALKGIKMTYAQRAGRNATTRGNSPLGINVYVTNTPDDEASWQPLGAMELTYTLPVDYANGTVENAAGEINIDFGGAYRYFRFEVTTCTAADNTEFNKGSQKPFWYLSECHFLPTEPVATVYGSVPENIRTVFEAQLAAAKTAIDAENATEEIISSLQNAYNDLLANMPDPARVTAVVTEARAELKAAAVGTEPGYYSQAGYDAFSAAIEAADAVAKPGITLEGVENAIASVKAATAAFHKTLILPAAGQYYFIRSASEKPNWQLNVGFNSKNAPVYSGHNGIQGAIRFTRQKNSYGEGGELVDSVNLYSDVKYLWYVEKSEEGKVVLRNVGTGMYFGYGTKSNAAAVQSTEPVELNLGFSKAGAFTIEIGDGQYANAQLGGAVVAWSDATDDNGSWSFESTSKDAYADADYWWTVTPGVYQIITLPVSVDARVSDGEAYTLVGQSDDNKFVLSKLSGTIEAGTPFIFKANEEIADDYGQPNAYFSTADGDLASLEGNFEYCLTPKSVNGLTGTIAVADTCYKHRAYFNEEGKLRVTNEKGQVAIGHNSGFFNGTHATGVSADGADAVIDLPENAVVNGITDVVVVPEVVDVYSLNGVLIRKNVKAAQAVKNLPAGVYVVAGQKVVVK